MYDWTDTFCEQARLSFPTLQYYIMQAQDHGDIDQLLEFLMALEYDGRMSA